MLVEQGNQDAFLSVLEHAPRSSEYEPETWAFRGVAREYARDWLGAAENFREAITLNPFKPNYYYRLAMAEERLGLREQALAHRRRTKEINSARALLPAACSDYFAARTADKPNAPNLAAACNKLAAICETMGWYRAAQSWSRIALSSL